MSKRNRTDYHIEICKETGKNSFSSEAQATRRMNSYKDIQRVYYCPHCDGFHLTSVTEAELLSFNVLSPEEENELLKKKIDKLSKKVSILKKEVSANRRSVEHLERQLVANRERKRKLKYCIDYMTSNLSEEELTKFYDNYNNIDFTVKQGKLEYQ